MIESQKQPTASGTLRRVSLDPEGRALEAVLRPGSIEARAT